MITTKWHILRQGQMLLYAFVREKGKTMNFAETNVVYAISLELEDAVN